MTAITPIAIPAWNISPIASQDVSVVASTIRKIESDLKFFIVLYLNQCMQNLCRY